MDSKQPTRKRSHINVPPRLHLGSWAELGQAAAVVRLKVFVQEQGIAATDEWDAADAEAVHAVLLSAQGDSLATGRLLPAQDGVGHVGRVAVLRAQRGKGLGVLVMQALEQAARKRGDQALELSAQCSVQGFYERLGYVAQGPVYDEVGIAHIRMAKPLRDS